MGGVRFELEIAHQSGKAFDLWAIFLPSPTGFLHIWTSRRRQRQEMWGFPAFSELAADLQ
jgi:hypothetical protein